MVLFLAGGTGEKFSSKKKGGGYKCPECGHAQLNVMVKSKRECIVNLNKIRISVVFTLAES
jgi:DNA-directed RNA polymerase subunit RPC12/RpoP